MKFDKIISLGSDCATRFNVDRYLKMMDPSHKNDTFYFDWLWRDKGFNSNLIVLREQFVMKNNEFELKYCNDGFQVYHAKSGFYFVHDFNFSVNAIDQIELVQAEFFTQFPLFFEKYQYIAQKTKELMKSKIKVLYIFAKESISPEQISEFSSFVNKDSRILFVPEESEIIAPLAHPSLIVFPIRHKGIDWTGDPAEWDRLFFESGIL